jgi:hypothetical protein
VELENVLVLDDMGALDHQSVMIVGLSKQPGVLQVLGEVPMHVRRSILHGFASAENVGDFQVGQSSGRL